MRILICTLFTVAFVSGAHAQEYAQKLPTQQSFKAGAECFSVGARQGWQRITFNPSHEKLIVVDEKTASPAALKQLTHTYKWSVDDARYPRVGADGHQGKDAKALEPYSGFKFDKAFPFGGLLARVKVGRKPIFIDTEGLVQTLAGVGPWVDFRINDTSLGDNGGALILCTLPPN